MTDIVTKKEEKRSATDEFAQKLINLPWCSKANEENFVDSCDRFYENARLLRDISFRHNEYKQASKFSNVHILGVFLKEEGDRLRKRTNPSAVVYKITLAEAFIALSVNNLDKHLKLTPKITKNKTPQIAADAFAHKQQILNAWQTLLSIVDSKSKELFIELFEKGLPHSVCFDTWIKPYWSKDLP